jgi:hypothetical protein
MDLKVGECYYFTAKFSCSLFKKGERFLARVEEILLHKILIAKPDRDTYWPLYYIFNRRTTTIFLSEYKIELYIKGSIQDIEEKMSKTYIVHENGGEVKVFKIIPENIQLPCNNPGTLGIGDGFVKVASLPKQEVLSLIGICCLLN